MTRLMVSRTAILVGLIVFGIPMSVFAARPTVVVSIQSVDDLLEDVDFVGETVGFQGLKDAADQFLNSLTGGDGLAGVNRDKPLGAYWSGIKVGQEGFGDVVVFLPVSDAEALKKLVSMFVPDFKDNNGEWTMTVQGQQLFAKVVDEYCYISNTQNGLSDVSDPEKIVNTEYAIAIDVNLASIPKEITGQILETAENEGRKGLENGPKPDSDAEAVGQKIGFEGTLALFKLIANEGDRLTLGVKVDQDSRLAVVDFGLTGRSNSSLAKSFSVYGKTMPAFAAVASDTVPLRLLLSFPTTGITDQINEFCEAVQKTTDESIDKDESLADAADKKAAKDVAKRLVSVVQSMVKSGSLHSIVVLESGDEDTVRVVGGARVAKGDEAGKLLDDVTKLSKESPEFAKLKIDVAKHAGARIHSVEGAFDDDSAAMFGNSPAHFAIRTDSLWFSLGGGNLEALKTALDASGKKVSKSEAPTSLRMKPATLVTLLEQKDEALVQRAETLAGEPGDVLNIEIAPTEKAGVKLHIEFGIELFKLFPGN